MKNRNSIKGEYNVGYSIGSTGVRDFQELLNRRNSQLAAQMETNDDEHRMEFVKTFRGVDFINDAACENANGIYMALSNMTKQVTWITSFNQWDKIDVDLLQMIIRKVNAIVYYGTEDEQTHSFIDALSIRNEQSEEYHQDNNGPQVPHVRLLLRMATAARSRNTHAGKAPAE